MSKKYAISLKALYDEIGSHLRYGGYIRKTEENGSEYYDLLESNPTYGEARVLLCDGEECTIVSSRADEILLVHDDEKICFSCKEFGIATFLAKEKTPITDSVYAHNLATAYCKEVGEWFGHYTELSDGSILIDNGQDVFSYDTPEAMLIDWEETLLESYRTDGTDWDEILEFIHATLDSKTGEGICRVETNDGKTAWTLFVNLTNGNLVAFGAYGSLSEALCTKYDFLNIDLCGLNVTTEEGIKEAKRLAQIRKDLNSKKKDDYDSRLDLIRKLRSCQGNVNAEALCAEAADVIESMMDTINTFIAADDLKKKSQAYQTYLKVWRERNNKDNLTYPTGDQVYKDYLQALKDLELLTRIQ